MMRMKTNEEYRKRVLHLLLFLMIFVISISQIDLSYDRIISSFERGSYILKDIFPPKISDYELIWHAALESIQIAILGTILGIILSLILCLFAAKNISYHISVSYFVKGFAGFVRAVPALIWALLFIVAVGLGPTAGILAIGINSVGMLVKIYAESIEEIDEGIIEALQATGASKFQYIMRGIIPSVASIFISWSLFRLDINIRYASVLGVVGAGGIGWELVRSTRLMNYDEAMGITIVIFFIVILSEALTKVLKKRLDTTTV
ncbi:phosphonate ABC transporter, permease protein PhnE [Evansella halocellulosilytica]|uniref:phosphonate ABC transporter, permease protein PhnE n=1 Tax=Evansella halocellulosilytica TaxID=2011013 RepID=UPI000BB82FE7|nr:phosphonate ABC transporter, permease protein PhnE [Evansella halocellulosilytica]